MSNDLTALYKTYSDHQLLLIIEQPDKYLPLAMQIAQRELDGRQLSDEALKSARQTVTDELQKREAMEAERRGRMQHIKQSAAEKFSPFVERTPGKTVRLLCFLLSALWLVKTIPYLPFFYFVFFESGLDINTTVPLLNLLLLPLTIACLWQKMEIGRILIIVWAALNLCTFLPTLYMMFTVQFGEYLLLPVFLGVTFYTALIYYFCKKSTRQVFKPVPIEQEEDTL